MSAVAFQNWLTAMRISGAEAARLLGVHPNTITRYKREGASRETALACAALYHRLEPWK
jgi:transcriptional regulator with XRE-family HTH domain